MNRRIDLIIEKHNDDNLWGRVTYNDNLITDTAQTVAELESNLKVLLQDFENVDPETVEFIRLYDVYALFQKFDYLKVSNIAKRAGMNASLLRQYASGVKHPSAEQAKKIEDTLHRLATQLQEVQIYTT